MKIGKIKLVLILLILVGSYMPFTSFAKEKEAPLENQISSEYTINYENVSIIEYIKFVSKICDINFIFDENELQFNVTIISHETITPDNVMSTLLQILRIHGLSLLEQDGNLVIHTNENVKQIPKVISDGELEDNSPIVTSVFTLKNINITNLAAIIKPLISEQAIIEVMQNNNQLIVTDIASNIKKIKELIEKIESPYSNLETKTYTVKSTSPTDLIKLTMQMLSPYIEGKTFIMTPREETGEIYITSTPSLTERALNLLNSLDVPLKQKQFRPGVPENIFTYKIQYQPYEKIEQTLQSLATSLKESGYPHDDFVETIQTMKYIPETNSLLFWGDQKSFVKLKDFLQEVDTPSATQKKSFFLYKIKNATEDQIISSLKKTAEDLDNAGVGNQDLVDAINNVKYIKESNSLLFKGNENTLNEIKNFLPSFDVETSKINATTNKQFFIYTPKNVHASQIEEALKNTAEALKESKLTNPEFLDTINSMQYIEKTHSLAFTGYQASLTTIKELIATIDVTKDTEEHKKITSPSSYNIYQLKYVSGDLIKEELDTFVTNLKERGIENQDLFKVIDNVKWIKSTNSIMLAGPQQGIEEAKQLIDQYDIPRKTKATPSENTNFFMYKPKNISHDDLENSLDDIASNLSSSELEDPDLLSTIKSIKYVPSTDSFIFTGNSSSLDKLKVLLSEIDVSSAQKTSIKTVGKTTFLIYKIKDAPVSFITTSLKALANDLKNTKAGDSDFIKAIDNMKYQKETNSLIFTGTPEALEKIRPLLERFDVKKSLEDTTADLEKSYFIYRPEYVAGPALESILQDFASHLKLTGLDNKRLYNCIETMKWVNKTHSLIFTADEATLTEIKSLLRNFDIPSRGDVAIKDQIDPIDNTSFLVYKLQYHKGNEIQTALRQVSTEMAKSNIPAQKNLLNTINSIQWIQVTNSLLCTGDEPTVTRLRELIKSLDVPLKQVFIEMLVVETTLSGLLEFGLNWGSKFKYKDKLVAGVNNYEPSLNSGSSGFPQNLNKINGTTNTPTELSIPFNSGFDLGVIGDIIMHKGKSFVSMGSLLNAMQTDSETTVIMTPKIITQDSKTSTIFIGRNIPYTGSFVSNTQTNTLTTSNLEYKDVGMNLVVTPVLGNSDTVNLDIALDMTDVANAADLNSGSVSGITTTKTSMNTNVHIPNKNFLILSGMIRGQRDTTKAGFPCLGGLPLIGAAFSETSDNNKKQNIVIFIRPHIINSYQDMVALTEAQEDAFRDTAGSPSLERAFEEGTELIKTEMEDEE